MKAILRGLLATATLLSAGAMIGIPASAAESGVKAGFITCNASSGWGLIFGSSRTLKCEYSSAATPTVREHYVGSVTKFGVDIGYLSSAVMVWAVIAPTANIAPGALAGNYAGVTGSATVGVGVGANVLVGGSGSQLTLQPVSIEGQTGLNVAAGVAALELRAATVENMASN
jgi:hypothetical protein